MKPQTNIWCIATVSSASAFYYETISTARAHLQMNYFPDAHSMMLLSAPWENVSLQCEARYAQRSHASIRQRKIKAWLAGDILTYAAHCKKKLAAPHDAMEVIVGLHVIVDLLSYNTTSTASAFYIKVNLH